MKRWLRRIRGMLGMGLTWAIGWAVIGGGIMEGIVDPHGEILDMWPQTLAIPGFLLGVVFSVVLMIAERRRRFDELSVPRFASLGALAGVLLGTFALGMGAMPALPLLVRSAIILAPMTFLSAASAAASLGLVRFVERRQLAGSGEAIDRSLAGTEPSRQLGGRN